VRFPRVLACWLALVVVVVCLAGAEGNAFAAPARLPQGKSASLNGVVMDPDAKPIPNATVVLTGKSGEKTVTANEKGEYSFGGLATGDYKLKASAPGFQPFETDVSLVGSTSLEIDAPLVKLRTREVPAAVPATVPSVTETPAVVQPGAIVQPEPAQTEPAQTISAVPQSFSVSAQKGKAALYGIVTDQSGAVIPNGTAMATPKAGAPVTAIANARGQYVLNLPPGQYKLSVEAPGFAPFETTDLALAAEQTLEIDATLQPPSSKTEINVESGGAAQIQTENAQVEGTITQKEVLQTGLNGRNFTQLIALAPGVSNQTGQDEALVGVKGSVKYSVNGGRVEYNNFDVDGSDVLNAGLNGAESTLMVYPSLDAISEVKVLTSNYGAQYGRSASGTVLVTTKSGGKDFHGGAYDFVRNEFFNARNYFDQTSRAPLYRRQDFGGTLGGPIYIPGVFNVKKDKTFFFWSEEFRLEKTPQEFNQAVPTLSERTLIAGAGLNVNNCAVGAMCANFSDVCPPAGTQTLDRSVYPDCPSVAGQPQPFVPVSATSQQILSTGMFPLPTSATGCNFNLPASTGLNTPCYAAVISPSTYWREELARLDHNFTQSMRLSFRYIHDSWDTTVATPEWGYVQNSFPTVQNRLNGPGTSMVVRLTNTISPKLLNEFLISYVDANITLRDMAGPGANLTNQVLPSCTPVASAPPNCMNYIFPNNAGGKPPGIVIAGTNSQYGGNGFTVDPSYAPWEHTNPTYSLGDDLGVNLGRHTLHFGLQVVDAQRSETNGAIGAATGDLQGILTFSNQNSITTGNAFADFLYSSNQSGASYIKSYQQDSAQLKYYNNYWITEPYVQDDWRVSQRLTINAGIRLSLFGNFHEKNLNAWNWVAGEYDAKKAKGLIIPPIITGPGGYIAENDKVFTPIPFDPTSLSYSTLPEVLTNGLVQCGKGTGKNAVPTSCMSTHTLNPAPRIGFAWDPKGDGKTSIRGGYGVFFEHGTAKEANTGSLEGGAPLVLTMTAPFPTPFAYSSIGVGGPNSSPLAFPLDVTSIPQKSVWPYVQQWSLSVQRQLPKDMVATVAYVGSKGTHLSAELQINQLPTPPTGPDTGINLNGTPYGPGDPVEVARDCSTFQPGVGFVAGAQGIVVTPQETAYANLVAACYGTTNPSNGVLNTSIPDPGNSRPYFGFRRILSLQNIADSQYHALQTTLRRTRGPVTVGVSYTYSHSFDDSSDRSDSSFVNSANIRSGWASSNFDQRHLFNLNYVYDLPKFGRDFRRMISYKSQDDANSGSPGPANSGLLNVLLDGWQVSGITVFQSGTPFSVINGGSNNLGISVLDNAGIANGAGTGSYPDVVANPRSKLPLGIEKFTPQSIGPLLFNPAAFAAPQGLTFGNAGRNFMNNPHRLNFDMSAFKNFKITEGSVLEFRAEAFNVFNHTEFRIFNPNIGNAAQNTISCYGGGTGGLPFTAAGGLTPSLLTTGNPNGAPGNVDCTTGSSFLRPIDAHRPRTIQLGLKYTF
jgi:hypothetical protein